jgi:hypothetical protein
VGEETEPVFDMKTTDFDTVFEHAHTANDILSDDSNAEFEKSAKFR